MRSFRQIFFTGLLLFINVGISTARPDVNRVLFLNIGQGDAALIQIEERVVLVDGGPGDYVVSKLGEYLPPWRNSIDLIVLTHPHLDHLSGLLDVLERYEIGEVWINPVCYKSSQYVELFDALKEKKVRFVLKDDVLLFEKGYLRVHYPFEPSEKNKARGCSKAEGGYWSGGDENVNNESIVLELKYRDTQVLFMGDVEKEQEERLLKSGFNVVAEVLKAGHHCSKTSTTQDFLDAVKPKLVICSLAEKNSYGHPSPELLKRLESQKIEYLITYREGDIAINL